MKSKLNSIFIIVPLIFTIIILAIVSVFSITNSAVLKVQLENVYKKSYYDLIDNVDQIEVNLSKLVATNSDNSKKKIIMDLSENCIAAVTNLGQLPIDNSRAFDVLNYFNKTYGFGQSLLAKIGVEKFSNSDNLSIVELHKQSKILLYDLNSYSTNISHNYNILENINLDVSGSESFNAGLVSNESSESNVPSLIYDGPFSDSVMNKEVRGLGNEKITIEDANILISGLMEKVGASTFRYLNMANGKIDTYNYSIIDAFGSSSFVQISVLGGLLISMNAFGNPDETLNYSIEQSLDSAVEISRMFKFENLQPVWWQESVGVLYVNLAPIIDGIIYYSDLVKVKVDRSTNEVIGWEATNYAYNHVQRELYSSSIGLIEGQSLLNPALTIVERNYAVIPNQYVGESNALEYVCTWEEYTYYIYLDATTGEEINIMRVVKTSSGDLLM